MPAAMVCPPVRSMNRPVRQMDAQNSMKKKTWKASKYSKA
jgi:hypothetical protein